MPVAMDVEKKPSYNGSHYSKESYDYNNSSARTSELFEGDRKSSAGRKTISEIVSQPDKRTRRKRGVIAPHAPFDTIRSTVDLNYDKYDKDEA